MATQRADFIDLQAFGDASLAEAIFDEVLLRNREHDYDESAADSLSEGPLSEEESEQCLVDSDDDGGNGEDGSVGRGPELEEESFSEWKMSAAMMTCVAKTE